MAMVVEREALVRERLGLIRGLLERHEARGAFLSLRRNFAWLTAGGDNHVVLATESGVAGVLVTRDDAIVVTANIEAARIGDEEVGAVGLPVETADWWDPNGIAGAAERLLGERPLPDEALEAELVPLRSRLVPFEHERMAHLGIVARDAVESALAEVEAGMTEDELAASLVGRLDGVRAPVVLVAADERIARYRHPIPTAKPIARRVMLVIVAERWGLNVALTRIRDLEAAGDEVAGRMAAAAQVERAMHGASRVGATLGDVLAAAQEAYASVGFPGEWRDHHQGGTIGYQGRERVATPGDPTVIEAGMAFAWNPSIAGAKVEDTFVLAADDRRRVVTSD